MLCSLHSLAAHRILLLCAAVIPLATAPAHADTWYVPGDYNSIQGAINGSADGDEIIVGPGIYEEHLSLMLHKGITIRSSDGPHETTIDGGGAGTVLTIESGTNHMTTIKGFTITNGWSAGQGAGANVDLASDAKIIECRFVANIGGNGGGVYVYGSSTIELIACTFRDNAVWDDGGALAVLDGSVATIKSCTFVNNQVPVDGFFEGGGAIYLNHGATGLIDNCTFTSNYAFDGGGAIELGGGGSDVTIRDCLFDGNSTDGEGGAIIIMDGGSSPSIGTSIFSSSVSPGADKHISGAWIDLGGNQFLKESVCPPDNNQDGDVDTRDFLDFLNDWVAGCQ